MESISRISSLLETARDLTLEAAQNVPRKTAAMSSSSRSTALPAQQIKKLLDSRHEREVLDGLRRVIALQYAPPSPNLTAQQQRQATLTFFPAVLKTLSHPSPSTRPLVYTYLLHHAEADPDTALLAVNTIQKSLSDSNPRVRALALKTMSGIRVPVLAQIVSLAIKKGVADLSPLVRKAAAFACVKCVRLDPSSRPQVEEYIATLLADRQYYVAGAAVQAFAEICPRRLDMIHPVYRSLCRMVVDMDEWGQLAVMRVLTVYARSCFPRRVKRVKRNPATQEEKARDFYEDLEPSENANEEDIYDEVQVLDPDLELFLTSIKPLLQSRNAAVVLSVTRTYIYLSPMNSNTTDHLSSAVGPLIALLRSSQDIQQVALPNIIQICLRHTELFVPYMRHFLLRPSVDAPSIREGKLEMLTLIFPQCSRESQNLILAELEHFSHSHTDLELVRESVRAIGRCCAASPSATASRRCLNVLLKQLHASEDPILVGEAMEVIRHLIQRDPLAHRKTVVRLAKNLDTLTSPQARASVVWLVGEYAAGQNDEGDDGSKGIAADVLRILVKGYADESEEVRAQIVLLAAKVYLHYLNAKSAKLKALDALDGPTADDDLHDATISTPNDPMENEQHPIPLLFEYAMLLARYTPSYSLRDRARTYRALLAVPSSTELASLLLLAPKPVPQAPSPSEARKDFVLGSASVVIGERLAGSRDGNDWDGDGIPDWVAEGQEPDPKLRDEVGDISKEKRAVGTGAGLSAGQRLDEALAADQRQPSASSKAPVTAGGVRSAGKEKTLDDWLDEEDGVEEETESEESEGEETESSEEESEEEESDEEEDEKVGLMR